MIALDARKLTLRVLPKMLSCTYSLSFWQDSILPQFLTDLTNSITALSLILSLAFGYHVLMHLPSIDFRAYKLRQSPSKYEYTPDAPKAVQEFTWTFDVDGEQQTVVTDGSYPNIEGTYVGVETRIIEEGFQPSILDFSIESRTKTLQNITSMQSVY